MMNVALYSSSRFVAAAWLAGAAALGGWLWLATTPARDDGTRWTVLTTGESFSWNAVPPKLAETSPAEFYQFYTLHLSTCATQQLPNPDGSWRTTRRPLSYVQQSCRPHPPEPAKGNFFDLEKIPIAEARIVIAQYLSAKLYFYETPNSYVLSYINKINDAKDNENLQLFNARTALLASDRDLEPSAQAWNYYVGFWTNPFRLPDFASINTKYGADPHDFLKVINVPWFYIITLILLPLTLLPGSSNFEHSREGGLTGVLDRRIAKKWKTAGFKDNFSSFSRYSKKHFYIATATTLSLAAIMMEVFHRDLYMILPDLAAGGACGHLYIRLTEYNWQWWHSQEALKRFSPVQRPNVTPAGEHGTASLQGGENLAASGFIDEA